jgi:hypothetical protein
MQVVSRRMSNKAYWKKVGYQRRLRARANWRRIFAKVRPIARKRAKYRRRARVYRHFKNYYNPRNRFGYMKYLRNKYRR